MCFGDNNAPHAIRLFNAQLKAHWENANDCFTHHGSTLKPEDKYSEIHPVPCLIEHNLTVPQSRHLHSPNITMASIAMVPKPRSLI